jgi:hypothetical protein
MKHNLDNDKMIESFFGQTALMGIASPVRGYHLCWILNRYLDLDFRAQPEDDIQVRKNHRDTFFTVFSYISADNMEHFIYENKTYGGMLFPEFKHLDFFLLVKMEDYSSDYILDLMASLRSIEVISMVTFLSDDKFKSPENLLI